MQVLHITPSTNGYEEVTLIANKINPTNGLALIEKDGEQYMTGGYILPNTDFIKGTLDKLSPDLQYLLVSEMRRTPFKKMYADEKDNNNYIKYGDNIPNEEIKTTDKVVLSSTYGKFGGLEKFSNVAQRLKFW